MSDDRHNGKVQMLNELYKFTFDMRDEIELLQEKSHENYKRAQEVYTKY